MKPRKLTDGDRAFFERVSVAVYANPFSTERDLIDRELAGGPVSFVDDALPRAVARIRRALERVGIDGAPDVRGFGDADRELLEHVLLFDVFHRHVPLLDAAIADERARGAPQRLGFAAAFQRELVSAGVPIERAQRAFELAWQMRRAFSAIAHGLVGTGPSMRRVREALWNAVFTRDIRRYERHLWSRMEDFSTLVLGETGTGKEAAAAAIGVSGFIPFDPKSQRFTTSFTQTFVPLHLASLAEGLVESELFGHEKGAFTGAVRAHEGVFARSGRHGVVFLDEVADVSTAAQVKLLRVLQERTYQPVGGYEARRFEGRVVAATHRPIASLRASGALRDDFYYRLSAFVIDMPSLRARLAETPGELRALTTTLLGRIVGHDDAGLVDEVTRALVRDVGEGYAWPGNVRELEHALRRVLLTGHATRDAHRDIAGTGTSSAFVAAVAEGSLDAQALLSGYCAALYTKLGSYEAVARATGLDRRTVRKHVTA